MQFKCALLALITPCVAYRGHSSLATGDGAYLSKPDVSKAFTAQGYTYDDTREALKSVSDTSGRVDLDEFADLYARLKEGGGASAVQTKGGKIKVGGSTQSSAHTINEDERRCVRFSSALERPLTSDREFTRHINAVRFSLRPGCYPWR